MNSIQHYYEKADFRLVDLRPGDTITSEDLHDIGFALTIMWKQYCEWEGVVTLNQDNQRLVNLIKKRKEEYLDFIADNVDDLELSKVLIDKFEELYGVIKK